MQCNPELLGDKTVSALLRLKDSGPQSFEDLLRELLARLTGQPFFLANSGQQGGLDGVVGGGAIAFEAKLYGSTSLNLRELEGEISRAARDRPNLELWLLATTARLGAQGRKVLEDAAAERVCAVLADSAWLAPRKRKPAAVREAEIRSELAAIRESPHFTEFLERFAKELLELPTWSLLVDRQNRRLRKTILQRSSIDFGTDFQPEKVVPRTVKADLGQWFSQAKRSSEPSVGVMLGERFDGKTWCVFDWLVEHLETLDFPVFFISSAFFVSGRSS